MILLNWTGTHRQPITDSVPSVLQSLVSIWNTAMDVMMIWRIFLKSKYWIRGHKCPNVVLKLWTGGFLLITQPLVTTVKLKNNLQTFGRKTAGDEQFEQWEETREKRTKQRHIPMIWSASRESVCVWVWVWVWVCVCVCVCVVGSRWQLNIMTSVTGRGSDP